MRWNRIPAAAAALALALQMGAAVCPDNARAAETMTAKERLVSKAADEQRVNNCRVPPELWGPVARPGCPAQETASAPPGDSDAAGEAASGAQ